MTSFPAAWCQTCGRWLSPQGSTKAAREAEHDHRENRRTFEGIQHKVGIYDSKDQFKREVLG